MATLARLLRRLLAAAILGAWAAGAARAEPFPSRTVTIIVPNAPGGATDVVARLVAERMTAGLGRPVVVENIAGASGTLAANRVAKAPPDGHTLLMGTIATHGIVPSLIPNLPYDTLADFTPVTQAVSQAYILVAHPSVPAKTIGEFIALSKAHPGDLTYASGGNGTAGHLFGALFNARAGVSVKHVPYRGSGPAMNDLVGGHVSTAMDVVFTTVPFIEAGTLRGLAVTSAARSPALPDVPTLAEAGLAGFDANGWNGVLVRSGTPPEIVGRLHDEIVRALRDPSVRAKVVEQGAEIVASTPEEFARFVRAEIERWRTVVKDLGVTIQ